VNSLPDAADAKKSAAHAPAAPQGGGGNPRAAAPAPAPEPAGDKAADKPTRKVSTDKVPIFTNPGF
jgi:hypothetical protein